MSIDMNTQIGGVGNRPHNNVRGNEVELVNPADALREHQSKKIDANPAVAHAVVEKTSGPTEADVINTPGTIAFQHMQNYLATGDLASYNFAHFAARMQLQQM